MLATCYWIIFVLYLVNNRNSELAESPPKSEYSVWVCWLFIISYQFAVQCCSSAKMPSHPNAEWTNSVYYMHIWRHAHQMTWQRLKLAHFLRGLECFSNKPFSSDYPPGISPFSLCMPLKWLPWEDGKPLIYPEVAHCMIARERECFILAMQRFPSDRLLRGYCHCRDFSVTNHCIKAVQLHV